MSWFVGTTPQAALKRSERDIDASIHRLQREDRGYERTERNLRAKFEAAVKRGRATEVSNAKSLLIGIGRQREAVQKNIDALNNDRVGVLQHKMNFESNELIKAQLKRARQHTRYINPEGVAKDIQARNESMDRLSVTTDQFDRALGTDPAEDEFSTDAVAAAVNNLHNELLTHKTLAEGDRMANAQVGTSRLASATPNTAYSGPWCNHP